MSMPEKGPLVSVIIPCHDGVPFVRQAINSVLRQSHSHTEVVVVDDASTDESWEVISSYGDTLIAIRNDRNQGACYSRNRGATLASGEFLLFLDADDYIEPDTIAALIDAMRDRNAAIAAADWRFLMKSGDSWVAVDSGFPREPPGKDFLRGWVSGWFVPCCALLWRRTTFDATGGWDQSLAANQDGDLILRALLAGARVAKARGGLALYRKRRGLQTSISNALSRDALTSRLRVWQRVQEKLENEGRLENYRVELGRSYYSLARQAYWLDATVARESEKRAWKLAGRYAASGTLPHRLLASLLGLGRKERLAISIRKRIHTLRSAAGWPTA